MEKLNCGIVQEMIGQALDRELDKTGIQALLSHISECNDCRNEMKILTAVDRYIKALNEQHTPLVLTDNFNKKIMAGIKQRKHFNIYILKRFAASRIAAMFVGLILGGLITMSVIEDAPRFYFSGISYDSIADKVNWNHNDTLQPGEVRSIKVIEGDDGAYYFRFQADQPVDIVILHHDRSNGQKQRLTPRIHGVHYASLNAPHKKDIIFIKNAGKAPLQISVRSVRQGSIKIHKEKSGMQI